MMNENTCTDEHRQKWTLALRREMGMPEGGSVADAVRWFAIGVPDERLGVQLSTLAIESRFDLVAAIFRTEHDPEPTAFAVAFRTLIGADACPWRSARTSHWHSTHRRRSSSTSWTSGAA